MLPPLAVLFDAASWPNIPPWVIFLIGNCLTMAYAFGILYNKVDAQCTRLKRLEALLDSILESSIDGTIKKHGR